VSARPKFHAGTGLMLYEQQTPRRSAPWPGWAPIRPAILPIWLVELLNAQAAQALHG